MAVAGNAVGGMKGSEVGGCCGMGKGVALGGRRVGEAVGDVVAVKTVGVALAVGLGVCWSPLSVGMASAGRMRWASSLRGEIPQMMKPRQ